MKPFSWQSASIASETIVAESRGGTSSQFSMRSSDVATLTVTRHGRKALYGAGIKALLAARLTVVAALTLNPCSGCESDFTRGDAARGRTIVGNRQVGLCLLCHSGPFPEEKFQGTLAPDLKGAGSRWTEGQLRLRIVDSSRLYPDTMMPSYYRVDGLRRVAPAFAGKPVLTAEQIEDVVASLVTLRD